MSFSIYEIAAVEPGVGKAVERSSGHAGKGDFAGIMGAHDSDALPTDAPVVSDADGVAAPPVEAPGSGEAAGAEGVVADAGEVRTLDD